CPELPSGCAPVRSRSVSTWAGVIVGCAARTSAATPATCGAAMLVPLMLWYVPPVHVEYTETPGAVTSIDGPLFEKNAISSSQAYQNSSMTNWQPASPPGSPSKSVIAETVMTSGKAAG